MKIQTLRSFLPELTVGGIAIIVGCLISVPPSAWLWWDVPPLELYYCDAYFHATVSRADPTALMPVEWLYKSASNRRDELATESDVVADRSGDVNNPRGPHAPQCRGAKDRLVRPHPRS